jgi:hypothetical protein
VNVQNSRQSMRSEHRRHDRLLVTRFAMDDAYPSETAEARQLIDSCAECAALAADIRTMSSSISKLPDAKRTRDFAITAEKAEELRGSRISRWMRGLATPKFGMLRPVAGVALSIGLVMAIVGVAMPGTAPAGDNTFGAAEMTSPTDKAGVTPNAPPPPIAAPGGQIDSPIPAQAPGFLSTETPEYALGAASPDTRLEDPDDVSAFAQSSPEPQSDAINGAYVEPTLEPGVSAEGNEFAAARPADASRELLFYAGLAIAGFSVLLLALAWFARRYFADPLLR